MKTADEILSIIILANLPYERSQILFMQPIRSTFFL